MAKDISQVSGRGTIHQKFLNSLWDLHKQVNLIGFLILKRYDKPQAPDFSDGPGM